MTYTVNKDRPTCAIAIIESHVLIIIVIVSHFCIHLAYINIQFSTRKTTHVAAWRLAVWHVACGTQRCLTLLSASGAV